MSSALETLFELDPGVALVPVRRSSNEVLRGQRRGKPVYLRITPPGHRNRQELLAELTWMQALRHAGLRVARPLRSTAGALVEQIAWGEEAGCREVVCAVAFAAAPGRLARKPDDYTPDVLASWATLLADLHRHARDNRPPGSAARQRWDQDQVFLTAQEDEAPETRVAQQHLRALVDWLREMDTAPDGFGLTHADLHLGNLTVENQVVTAFDFDDSCHHWFVHDLAVAVTSIRKAGWEYPGRFDPAVAESIFLERYFARGVLAGRWRPLVERFVAYRIALSACWASRARQTGQLDQEHIIWFERSLPWWLGQLAAPGR
jgi:amicoumacin kinase